MKVTSNTPIIITGEQGLPQDYTSAASGATRRARKDSRVSTRSKRKAKGDDFGSKVKRGLQNIAQSGAVDAFLKGPAFQPNVNPIVDPNAYIVPVDNSKPPMKIGYKIAIGVGIAAVVGTAVWYFGFRKKK